MEVNIEIDCCLCKGNYKAVIQLPEGWATQHDTIYEEHGGFCPTHSKITEFTDAQCPGCIGGWGDCSLWSSFAYNGKRSLTEEDFKKMRIGICPKRVNGTFSFNQGAVDSIDLSEQADSEAGIALEEAIKNYWELYPED